MTTLAPLLCQIGKVFRNLEKRLSNILLIAAFASFFTQAQASSIVANFDDGSDNILIDAYPGGFGSGTWLSAWTIKTNNMTASSVSVLSTAPTLSVGSGNYLKVLASSPGSVSSSGMSVVRQYGSSSTASAFDLSQSIQYQFSVRPETDTGYIYSIYDSATAAATPSSPSTWIVRAQSGYWGYAQGLAVGDGTASNVYTSVAVETGVTYVFNVVANPSTRTWTLVISNTSGTVLYSSITDGTTLYFRSSATSLGGYLGFNVSDSSPTSAASDLGMSFDSITISQIPENGTISLMVLGGILFFLFYRLKNKKVCAI